ncbi:hypothetical protein IOD16_08910 [Saccharothrix sp. 6-C]|uniref:hypothetical protein n=1 Tax=Saccharothrix sp. 6-C TaxID=2781735 RepID=UPI001916CDBF|nr:hypothetical protein [Saccharothrix sp. 6-C]QQQ78553.1 hypothetical protein IOD16_08910 [Saccharothrix sp. 6-C]
MRATPAELSAMHDTLRTIIATRAPAVIPSVEGDPEHTCRALLAVLERPTRGAGA